ncbi:GNAT family N-acetyltransferase [Paenibacillus sp. MWE-103]|uniref:GNAT family N-acetyltransferase n=1 Tax=Paenibacillus artemisiicola TaxID=1172618 RepID=A0ABS3WIR3_9BACL|nr:GNAT family N-acetyltransferase [Paenibacillus artemisiicola]
MGTCGYHCWVREERSRAELGFDLAKPHWGKGLMREALKPVIAFGFERMGLDRIEATVDPKNKRSLALLNKLNFELAPALREGLAYFYLDRQPLNKG